MAQETQLISVTGSQDSRMEILMISTLKPGNVFHTNQDTQGKWVDWDTPASNSSKFAMAVSALDGNGRLALAWLNNGSIWVSAANQANGALFPSRQLDTTNLQQLKIAKDADGRLEFLALDSHGALWSIAQSVAGSWDNMNISNLQGTKLQQIAVTPYGPDQRLTVVALGGNYARAMIMCSPQLSSAA